MLRSLQLFPQFINIIRSLRGQSEVAGRLGLANFLGTILTIVDLDRGK